MVRFIFILVTASAIALTPVEASAGINWPWKKSPSHTTSKPAKTHSKKIARVERDVQRLESVLAELKTSAKLSDKAWKSATSEAHMLTDRIYKNVNAATADKKALRAAEDLRAHVQQMKEEAERRNYEKTREHAARALSAAARLDEWAG